MHRLRRKSPLALLVLGPHCHPWPLTTDYTMNVLGVSEVMSFGMGLLMARLRSQQFGPSVNQTQCYFTFTIGGFRDMFGE